MKATEVPIKSNNNSNPIKNQGQMKIENTQNRKPPFRPARDDTKPPLHDPILRSDPIETEEAVLRLPPFSINRDHKI
ncbi:uncharacterized protein LOC102618887 [Citrus sinensis]|uniref:uncharacterized protein LOC102618887 n=1 Tax=Citrus sinensis TaxID=2711 RepID=UPI0003D73EA5|nr:uncharacterized protein LOC102618887 [Citrus sinensis]